MRVQLDFVETSTHCPKKWQETVTIHVNFASDVMNAKVG